MAELNSSAPSERRESRRSQQRKPAGGTVTLEKVLGITTVSSSGLTSDPNTSLVAYPAGSAVVLLQPRTTQQNHILNGSRKPFTAVAFSHDGKHLATGESGHRPCVRVWEVGGCQVAEVQSHKHGVSCVAFSSNGAYIVSVGYQHDMTVSVWDWRKGSIMASNKVSSRVLSVSFSQDSSYFVTAGNRHVKFWYLDASRDQRIFSTVPLIGRSGLLNNHKTSVFCGVACGRGLTASNTYCVTSSGLLCLFNRLRHLEAWVDLKTTSASCLAVSEDFIFCGCADGLVQVFSPTRLQYLSTLPRPRLLGAEQGLPVTGPDAQNPPTLGLTLDPRSRMLTCVYGDHSIYVWDVHDVCNVRKIYAARYHGGPVWDLEVYPELPDPARAHLPASSFLSCSSDHTVRFWNTGVSSSHRNLCGDDLLNVLYVGGEAGEAADGKAGVRVLAVSPDGQQLAAGDRRGDVRVFGLQVLDQLVKIEAHDSEVVCLEYSPACTGVRLLASAGRDRLVHVFDQSYSLLQTLNHHSAPINAVRFTGESPEIHMVTCSVDKSITFQTAEQTPTGLEFSRCHSVVVKTSLYDMDCSGSQVMVACQDRNVRVYGVDSGRMRRCLKGTASDRGALLKVRMDPSGSFFASSCSNKNIDIFDLETGECVASLFGHSETVTSLRFSPDCRHLMSASADSCICVWRLNDHMTSTMKRRLQLRPAHRRPAIRRETFITTPAALLAPAEEEEDIEQQTPVRPDTADDALLLQTNGKLPLWFRKLAQDGACPLNQSERAAPPPQCRWAERAAPPPQCRWAERAAPLVVCAAESEEEDDFHPQSLEQLLGELETEVALGSTFTCTGVDRSSSMDDTAPVYGPLEATGPGAEPVWSTQLSPDSACSEGSAGSLDQHHDLDTDSLSQSSSAGSPRPEDDEDRSALKDLLHRPSSLSEERFDTELKTLQTPEEKLFLNPRLSISTRFLSRFQDRVRVWPVRAPPSIPNRISEESHGSCMTVHSHLSEVKSERSSTGSAAWTRTGSSSRADPPSRAYADPSSVDSDVDQDPPLQTGIKESLTPSSAGPQSPDPHLPDSGAPPIQSSRLQVEATPPQVSSQHSSAEETPTNQNQTVIQSPVLLAPPITETGVQPGPGDSVLPGNTDSAPLAPPLCCSSLLLERLRPQETDSCQSAPPAGLRELSTGEPGVLPPSPASHNQEVCRQQCQHATIHLQQAAAHLHHAVQLYQQLGSLQPNGLQEALSIVQSHLQEAPPPLTRRSCTALFPAGGGRDNDPSAETQSSPSR